LLLFDGVPKNGEMERYQPATRSEGVTVHAMLGAAIHFGLTREEAWQAFNQVLAAGLMDATAPEYRDEVAGALAREILEKQRRILRGQLS
jgi:hypothetical protein